MTPELDTLKRQILEHLRLTDVRPEDLDPEAPLFEGPLELDSIDALELMMLLEKEYGVRIEDPKEGRKILHSVRTMADYIASHPRAPA